MISRCHYEYQTSRSVNDSWWFFGLFWHVYRVYHGVARGRVDVFAQLCGLYLLDAGIALWYPGRGGIQQPTG